MSINIPILFDGMRTEETQNEFRAAYGVYTRKETFLVAIFHSTAKVCSASAKAKIDYISRQKKYSYSRKAEDLIYFEENNLPKWAKNAREFFAEMDKQEVSKQEKEYKSLSIKERKEKDRELKLNGETLKKKVKCREIEFSLPIELGSKENYIKFAKEYCKEIMGDNHVYAFAIHENDGAISGKKNPHVHLVYSDRIIEHDREVAKEDFCRQRTGYKKDMDIVGSKRSEWIDKNRKLLADKINEFLKSKSIDEKVSHRSFKERGINQKPTIHLGADLIVSLKKGKIARESSIVLVKYAEVYEKRYKAYIAQKIAKKTKDLDIPFSKRIKAGFELLVHKAYSFESDEHRKTWLAKQKSIFNANSEKKYEIKTEVHDELEKRYEFVMEQRFKNLTSDPYKKYDSYNWFQSKNYDSWKEDECLRINNRLKKDVSQWAYDMTVYSSIYKDNEYCKNELKELKIKLGEEIYQECFNEGVLKGQHKLDLLKQQKQDSIQVIDKEPIQSEQKHEPQKEQVKEPIQKKATVTIQKIKNDGKGIER